MHLSPTQTSHGEQGPCFGHLKSTIFNLCPKSSSPDSSGCTCWADIEGDMSHRGSEGPSSRPGCCPFRTICYDTVRHRTFPDFGIRRQIKMTVYQECQFEVFELKLGKRSQYFHFASLWTLLKEIPELWLWGKFLLLVAAGSLRSRFKYLQQWPLTGYTQQVHKT